MNVCAKTECYVLVNVVIYCSECDGVQVFLIYVMQETTPQTYAPADRAWAYVI